MQHLSGEFRQQIAFLHPEAISNATVELRKYLPHQRKIVKYLVSRHCQTISNNNAVTVHDASSSYKKLEAPVAELILCPL